MRIEGPAAGYSTRQHLLCDLDHASCPKTVKVALMLLNEYPELGSCLIMHAGWSSHHLIFASELSWRRQLQLYKTLEVLGIEEDGRFEMRHRRQDVTLRVTRKIHTTGTRRPPKFEHIHYNGGLGLIRDYLYVWTAFNMKARLPKWLRRLALQPPKRPAASSPAAHAAAQLH